MMKAEPTSAQIPLLDLKAQYASLREEITAAIERVCEAQRFIGGPEVVHCEEEVAAYCDCRYGVAVSSGTDALLCGMMALGIGAGDEVIVPSFTFFATAGCVARLGARPIFVDVDPDTFNTTAEFISPAITDRTKLIIPVHLFGQCAELDGILELAGRHGIRVMEDAAQAIGARHRRRKAGSLGHLGTLSFFPSKNLGGIGDGGMILTNDEGLARRCRILRDHGADPKYHHKWVGGNFRLDALQAAVVRVKLKYVEEWSRRRIENARRYDRLFADSIVRPPVVTDDNVSVFNQYVIRVPRRDALKRHLASEGIATDIYYPVPLHLQACFADLGGRPGDLPNSEGAAKEVLALPVYPELAEADQRRIARTILAYYRSGS